VLGLQSTPHEPVRILVVVVTVPAPSFPPQLVPIQVFTRVCKATAPGILGRRFGKGDSVVPLEIAVGAPVIAEQPCVVGVVVRGVDRVQAINVAPHCNTHRPKK
jgi:hypothetical protein